MVDLSAIQPAPGHGSMTREQLQSQEWRCYGHPVRMGVALLNATAGQEGMHGPDWREVILAREYYLDMSQPGKCLLGILLGGYDHGCSVLGLGMDVRENNESAVRFGFTTCPVYDTHCCDPAAAEYKAATDGGDPWQGLRDAWLMYLRAVAS